jgi:two-component system, cell cycle sensor histidine kinase and response regulator CckA
MVVGTHALRRGTSLVYCYAVLAFMTFASWAAPHGEPIAAGPFALYVESSVFFSAALLGVFLLYVAEGPRAGRMGLFVLLGTSVCYTAFAQLLHAQFPLAAVNGALFPSASLRAGTASVVATLVDLVLLTVVWELLQRKPWIPLVLRVFCTLVVVFAADALVYVPGAWAGAPGFMSMFSGNMVARTGVAAVLAPLVALYLRHEIRNHGLSLEPRPVFSMFLREDLERALLSARHQLRIGAEALWESEERYRRMVDDIPTMVFRFSALGTCTYANQALSTYYGRPVSELVGQSVLTSVAAQERDLVWQAVQALTPAKPTVEFVVRVFPRPGDRRFNRWLVRGIFSARGEGVAYQAVGEDITAHSQVEAERQRLSAAIDQANDCVGIVGAEGLLEYVNPAFERATGFPRAELVGKHYVEFSKHLESNLALAESLEALRQGLAWSGRVREANAAEVPREYQVTLAPIKNGQVAAGHVLIARDISREVGLEQQLRQAQRMEAVGHLAAGLAHDFNNLLSAIWSGAEFAYLELEQAGGPRDATSALRDMRLAADRAALLTRQLLALSRQERIEPALLNLSEQVERLQPLFRRLLPSALELEFSLDPALPEVLADPIQIDRAILNLVVNARDAMPRGGVIRIATALDTLPSTSGQGESHPRVVLVVADHGEGMSTATVERVFDPFFTTKRLRGTGLGLSTVYGIVQNVGGQIRVQSRPGVGTVFRLYFPIADVANSQVSLRRSRPESGIRPVTVLYCEHDPHVRQRTVEVLEVAGYRVLVCADPGSAVALIRSRAEQPDALLADIVLADRTGPILAEALREQLPGLPAVFFSGEPRLRTVERSGGDWFVSKPYQEGELLAVVARAISRR